MRSLLLSTAFGHVIREPNIEAGFERFRAITCCGDYDGFRDTVAACVRDGLVREPVRLPEGALQCHWHLELTPKGVEAARALCLHSPAVEGNEAAWDVGETPSQPYPRSGRGES
jgi:hypothetical protein